MGGTFHLPVCGGRPANSEGVPHEKLHQMETACAARGACCRSVRCPDSTEPNDGLPGDCAYVYPAIEQFRYAHPSAVAVVYHHFPIRARHPFAFTAALAADCAGAQGRFEELSQLFFSQQPEIGVKSWATFAAEAGVRDTIAFDKCVASRRFEKQVQADLALAEQLGLPGTPTVIINGKPIIGGGDITTTLERLPVPSGSSGLSPIHAPTR